MCHSMFDWKLTNPWPNFLDLDTSIELFLGHNSSKSLFLKSLTFDLGIKDCVASYNFAFGYCHNKLTNYKFRRKKITNNIKFLMFL